MRYLWGTKDYKLTYRHTDHLEVIGYLDSDLVGCLETQKFTSGCIFFPCWRCCILESTKQTIVSSSIMEAKIISCYEVISQVLWLRNFITSLKVIDSIARSLRIYYYNLAAIFFSKNNNSRSHNKHVNIKFLGYQRSY